MSACQIVDDNGATEHVLKIILIIMIILNLTFIAAPAVAHLRLKIGM